MNYYEVGRTNYVKVKDEGAFRTWAELLPECRVVTADDGTMALIFEDGTPTYRTSFDDNEEDVEINLAQEMSEHLAPGEVAVMTACGYEGVRYVTGYAWAVNSAGEFRSVDIHSIYDLAEELMDDDDPRLGVGRAAW